jgi:hypothetical protein
MNSTPTFLDVIRSEARKFRTVRSSWITGLITLVLLVGLGALFSWATASQWKRGNEIDRLTFNPIGVTLGGANLAQLAVGVLGIMFITAEFSTGSISTTLTATPSRWKLLAAKAAVLKIVVLLIGELGAFAAFAIGQAILKGNHIPSATFGTPGALRAIVLTGLYLLLIAIFAMGIGTLLRHTAGAISIYVGVLLIVPILSGLLPSQWGEDVRKWLPLQLGGDMSTSVPTRALGHFSPWAATLVMVIYATVMWTAGAVTFARRDV